MNTDMWLTIFVGIIAFVELVDLLTRWRRP
jgi:hypothetical protein